MLFKRLVFTAVLFATPAAAQQQPPYVPFVIDETDYKQIMTYLGDQPAKFSNPLINKLIEKEQAAVAKAEAETRAAVKPDLTKGRTVQ